MMRTGGGGGLQGGTSSDSRTVGWMLREKGKLSDLKPGRELLGAERGDVPEAVERRELCAHSFQGRKELQEAG